MRLRHLVVLSTLALLALSALAAGAAEHAYVGSKNCRKCHIKQWKSWSETAMAQSFEKLRPGMAEEAKVAVGLDPQADYTTDPSCVKCHVTGHGAPGGFVSEAETPDHLGVGCEMCHGPGGTYTQDQYMSLKNKEYAKAEVVAVGLVETVSEAQCVVCHNSESPFVDEDFVFDFAARSSEGTHESYGLKYQH